MAQRVALVTGASSGIGAQTARALHEAGFVVHGAARRVDRMRELAEAGVRTLSMDVTDDASLRAGVDAVLAESGRIDLLVNNAGYGSYGAVEDVPLSEARAQFEVNVFGAAALIAQVLPGMRERRSGTIVNISSMGGRIHTPMGAWYHATKFALEALSDSLRLEVAPFGIRVVVVEPGAIRTEWGQIAADNLRAVSGDGPYADLAERTARTLADSSRPDATLVSDPSVIARTVVRAAMARRPRTRYAVGAGAKPLILGRTLLPDRAFDRLITRTVAPRR
jgi:NAD(P)-dependent dehydrogenase (short-subunit alcohol dehydrogenase family)